VSRRALLFDTTDPQAPLFTRRRAYKKHLWPKLTAKIKVHEEFIMLHRLATSWVGVWIDVQLTVKEHYNRRMKKAGARDARLRTLMKT
jgi:hypothetical protein